MENFWMGNRDGQARDGRVPTTAQPGDRGNTRAARHAAMALGAWKVYLNVALPEGGSEVVEVRDQSGRKLKLQED